MEYILDGAMMNSYEDVHFYIGEVLEIPYGNNLDALHDILTALNHYTIRLQNTNALLSNLGNYGAAIIKVLYEAARENEGFTLIIE